MFLAKGEPFLFLYERKRVEFKLAYNTADLRRLYLG
jgi:hypothetical protein